MNITFTRSGEHTYTTLALRDDGVMLEVPSYDRTSPLSVLLRLMHEGLETNWPAARALLSREWKPNKPSRGPLEAEEVRRVCGALREAHQRWQALAIGQSTTVSWPLDGRIKR